MICWIKRKIFIPCHNQKWFYNNVHFIKIFLEQNVFLNYCNCWLWLLWLTVLEWTIQFVFLPYLILFHGTGGNKIYEDTIFPWNSNSLQFQKKVNVQSNFFVFYQTLFFINLCRMRLLYTFCCPAMFREISQSMCKVCKLHLNSLPAFL